MPVSSRLIAASALAAALAAGATGVALADSSNTATATPTPSASPSGDSARPDKGDRPGGRHKRGMFGARGALHGEFVVPNAAGGFQTTVFQRGEVTAVSKTEITVRSEDAFTTSYAVTADTLVNAARDGITTIEKGAQVNVVAKKDGDKATAVHIGDQSARKGMRERLGLDATATGV